MTLAVFKQPAHISIIALETRTVIPKKKKLAIAIPASITSDVPHLREKTSRIGTIGRAAAIFRVNEIIIYADSPKTNQKSDAELIATLLSYMETPQYLRKRLFTIRPELQYAGILPPLRTRHHPLNRRMKDLVKGEYREAVAISHTEKGTLVDVGVEKPALVPGVKVAVGKRLTVAISRTGDQIEVELADRSATSEYWGYTVTQEKEPLIRVLKSRHFDLTIATSRYGVLFNDLAERIRQRWKIADTILIAFGSPGKGLSDIAKQEGFNLSDVVDFVVNSIPAQATETVRTEEAVLVSLAIFNVEFTYQCQP